EPRAARQGTDAPRARDAGRGAGEDHHRSRRARGERGVGRDGARRSVSRRDRRGDARGGGLAARGARAHRAGGRARRAEALAVTGRARAAPPVSLGRRVMGDGGGQGYFQASRAPRYSLFFALPLLLGYEVLAFILPTGETRGVRNGAEVIFRLFFDAVAGSWG